MGPDRAHVLRRLAAGDPDMQSALRRLDEALDHADDDVALRADILRERIAATLICHGVGAARTQIPQALKLAERLGDPGRLADVLGVAAEMTLAAGDPAEMLLERMLAVERQARGRGRTRSVMLNQGRVLVWGGRGREARVVLDELTESARAHGDEAILGDALFHRAELNLREGRYAEAELDARDTIAVADGARQPQARSGGLYVLCYALTYRGEIDEARAAGELGVRLSRDSHDEIFWIQNEGALGFVELSVGDLQAADGHLRSLWPTLTATGMGEPSIFPVLPNAIESLLGLRELDQAESLLSELEACGARLDSPWALSQAARCRGLAVAARGEGQAALEHFTRSLTELDRTTLPFERGRALLAQGATLRRLKRRSQARTSLENAASVFAELGAPLWERRARAELARIGGRPRSDGTLTPSERRLAELVARGLTNRQAAAELYVTVNTVEKSLTRIYAKLDVHSRTALAARLRGA